MIDDREAVARFLRRRNEASFLVIFREHTPALMMMALRLMRGSSADAEDAVQEAWMRAVAALPRFAWRSSLRTWLCGFVVNCCREIARKRPLPAPDPSPPEGGIGMDLERGIAELPAAAREVFVLHELYGFTHDEVAGLLGIDSGTSRSQLHHARRSLRAFLGDEHAERN